MLTKLSTAIILIIATIVWGLSLWVSGIKLSWYFIKPYSITLATLTACIWLFDKYLWKICLLNNFLHRPNLNGTWQVKLKSTYKDPKSGKSNAPIEGFVTIQQTFSSLSIRLMTEQAESFLVASNLEVKSDGSTYIYGVYQSDPNIHSRSGDSVIHYGSFVYRVLGKPPIELSGQYWTDRNTSGSIDITNKKEKLYDSFQLAKQAFKCDINDVDLLDSTSQNT